MFCGCYLKILSNFVFKFVLYVEFHEPAKRVLRLGTAGLLLKLPHCSLQFLEIPGHLLPLGPPRPPASSPSPPPSDCYDLPLHLVEA